MPSYENFWVLLCRPGFEAEAAEEARAVALSRTATAEPRYQRNSGWALLASGSLGHARAPWLGLTPDRLIFSRQAFLSFAEVRSAAPAGLAAAAVREAALWRDRERLARGFSSCFVEAADGDEGRRLWPLCEETAAALETELAAEGFLPRNPRGLPRLHLFLHSPTEAWIGVSDPHQSSPWPMGIPRLRLPSPTPSRSARKLEEALLFFIPEAEQMRRMKPGSRVIDLGAAPGGWSSVLARRGLLVDAVDNGPIAPEVLATGLVTHVQADGFTYRPERPVRWMVCDMVTPPERAARLVSIWAAKGLCSECVFNLKLPRGGNRLETVRRAEQTIRRAALEAGHTIEIRFKHLYHDREEVTGHFRLEKTSSPSRRAPAKRATPSSKRADSPAKQAASSSKRAAAPAKRAAPSSKRRGPRR